MYNIYLPKREETHALVDKSRHFELSQPRPTTRHEVPWAEVFPRIAIQFNSFLLIDETPLGGVACISFGPGGA